MTFGLPPADGSRFASAWSDLAGVGRDHRRGGYSRHGFDDADCSCGSGSPSRPPGAGWTWRTTATAMSGPGGASRARTPW